jgi:putative transposase
VLNDEAAVAKASPRLVSRSGVPLTRATTFRFTLDPNRAQHQQLLAHAGAARLAFNHHLARVKANLDQRSAERSYGIAEADLTPSLSWSKVSFINEMNAWKDGRAADARVALDDDGNEVRGLAWRNEVSADVFECASVNAAQALANWSKSRSGQRAGKPARFPRFKSRHKTAPAFRLRAKYTEGTISPVRSTGPRSLRLPKLGVLRVHEHTGRLARLLAGSRFHVYAASVRYERGRWTVCVTGLAAELHHERRSPKHRHQARVGVDIGVSTLAVVADETGRVLHAHEGVKALQRAQARLKLANQSYSRTKRLKRPSEVSTTFGQGARQGGEPSPGPAAPDQHRARPRLYQHHHRGPQRRRDAHQPTARTANLRCGIRGVASTADLQGHLVRHRAHRGQPMVPFEQDVLRLRQR